MRAPSGDPDKKAGMSRRAIAILAINFETEPAKQSYESFSGKKLQMLGGVDVDPIDDIIWYRGMTQIGRGYVDERTDSGHLSYGIHDIMSTGQMLEYLGRENEVEDEAAFGKFCNRLTIENPFLEMSVRIIDRILTKVDADRGRAEAREHADHKAAAAADIENRLAVNKTGKSQASPKTTTLPRSRLGIVIRVDQPITPPIIPFERRRGWIRIYKSKTAFCAAIMSITLFAEIKLGCGVAASRALGRG
jgi:hypothetical protein